MRQKPAMRLSMRVWDLPTRLFHAAIPLVVIFGIATLRMGRRDWHTLSAEILLALVIWRLVWGVMGSATARLGAFAGSPLPRRQPDDLLVQIAAGGWWVLAMLASLAVQAIAGLGHLIVPAATVQLATVELINTDLLGAAVVIHLVIVVANARLNGQSVLRPMLTGKQRMPAAMRAPRMAPVSLALLVLFCAAGGTALIVRALAQ